MAKAKSVYVCQECGYEAPKWMGQCPACKTWNRMQEQLVVPEGKKSLRSAGAFSAEAAKPVRISEIEPREEERIVMPSTELNRVLGGGLVLGSLTLIGGDPGIGKSTLLLQNVLCMRGRTVMYVSGEESREQLKMRADRLARPSENVFILCETSLENILGHARHLSPQLMVVDSIQTMSTADMESTAGSISQVRECAARLLRYSKETGVPVILVGHINKEGVLAGPKVLEHIVDTVLQFEGDRQNLYRLLRPVKNRFGSTSEIGIYEMVANGLREVRNPSEMLLSGNGTEGMSGSAIGVTMEGNRPFLVEVQALVSSAAYGTPQRSVTGADPKRLNMLLAVLEKRARFKLIQKDVFLNIAGGMKVADPALDAPIIAAVMSSNLDIALPDGTVVVGEVGLSGEIRTVSRIDRRVAEAEKLGFKTIYIPKRNLKGTDASRFKIQIIEVGRVDELLRSLFSGEQG